jgi:acetyl-CoA carboxylase biotin carboxyl carrier protein
MDDMDATRVFSEIAGSVWKVVVEMGQSVDAGQEIVVLESMKMEIPILSPHAGTVSTLFVHEGQSVVEDDSIAEISR